jgi:hypothetical protein
MKIILINIPMQIKDKLCQSRKSKKGTENQLKIAVRKKNNTFKSSKNNAF